MNSTEIQVPSAIHVYFAVSGIWNGEPSELGDARDGSGVEWSREPVACMVDLGGNDTVGQCFERDVGPVSIDLQDIGRCNLEVAVPGTVLGDDDGECLGRLGVRHLVQRRDIPSPTDGQFSDDLDSRSVHQLDDRRVMQGGHLVRGLIQIILEVDCRDRPRLYNPPLRGAHHNTAEKDSPPATPPFKTVLRSIHQQIQYSGKTLVLRSWWKFIPPPIPPTEYSDDNGLTEMQHPHPDGEEIQGNDEDAPNKHSSTCRHQLLFGD